MLFQTYDFFLYFMVFFPNLIYSGFDIAILIVGILIKRKKSYNYGLYLVISSIISLVSTIIYFTLYYPLLINDFGSDPYTPTPQHFMRDLILLICNLLFLGLRISNEILLVLAFYKIYQTHKKH
jgi:hypothetical protein